MTISNQGWVESPGVSKKKIKCFPIEFTCPECHSLDPKLVGFIPNHVFEPVKFVLRDANKEGYAHHIMEEGVTICDVCGKEFFYRFALKPYVQLFKLVLENK